tara:strand:+ start:658 stop:1413 length:756 start_codon:yes stop_codon:yes gene_type:complete
MKHLHPTIAGQLRNVGYNFSGTNAWDLMIPDTDTTAGSVDTDDDAQGTQATIYTLHDYIGSNATSAEIKCLIMSFDTSTITQIPLKATLTVYGHTNSVTGVNGHSTDGILGLKTTGMASTTELTTSDWGDIDLSGAGPTLYTDTLTTWNIVDGGDGVNTFTLNSTALTDMFNNNTFQIVFTHKFFYDHYDSNPPYAYGNNSPDGDDSHSTTAGAYFLGTAAYKPILSYLEPPSMEIKSGNLTLNGGNLTIK